MKTGKIYRQATSITRLSVITIAALAAFILALPAAAQNRPQKIGVVDVDRIMARSAAFQAAANRIKSELQPLNDKYKSKLDERDRMEQSLRERSTVLKAEEVTQQKDKYFALDTEVNDASYQIKKESDRLQREILEPVMKRLKTVIEDIAKSQNYDLVLYANQLFYFSDSVDLTPLVMQALDRGEGRASTVSPEEKSASDTKSRESSESSSKSSRSSSSRRSRRN